MASLGSMDMNDWMADGKLSKEVCSKLKEREVTMDELLEFEEAELKSFCDDMDFDSLQKARLLQVVKSARSNQEYKDEETRSFDTNRTKGDDFKRTAIVTQQENDKFNELCAHQQKVEKLINAINDGYKSLDGQSDDIINDIVCCVDECITKLRIKQKELLMQIDKIYKYKNTEFKNQTEESNAYFQYIVKMRDDFEYFSNDQSMHKRQRMIKLQSMLNEMNQTNEIAMIPKHSPYLQLSQKSMLKLSKYFDKLQVSHCDNPPIPIINVKSTAFHQSSLELVWNIGQIGEFEANIKKFEVYYTKIRQNRTKTSEFYEEDTALLSRKMKKILKCGQNTFKMVYRLLPSFFQMQFNKIKEFSNNDEEIKNLISSSWVKCDIPITSKTVIDTAKYKMKQLEYSETYLIKMRSFNGNEYSDFSQIIMIKTPPLKLSWQYNKNSKAFKYFNPLTDSRMIIESRKSGEMYRIIGQNVLSRKFKSGKSRVCVELIVNKMSNTNYGTSIGFMSYPLDKNNANSSIGSNAKDFALCMSFGGQYMQVKYGGRTTNYYMNLWPWHKTRNGDSFIFALDLSYGNCIAVWHNGVHLRNLLQQYGNTMISGVVIPKKFVFGASFINDQVSGWNIGYSRKRSKKQKYVVADVEIRHLEESDMTKFRMVLRMMWYNLLPWFIRVNFRIIVLMSVILYYMFRFRHILRWNMAATESDDISHSEL